MYVCVKLYCIPKDACSLSFPTKVLNKYVCGLISKALPYDPYLNYSLSFPTKGLNKYVCGLITAYLKMYIFKL